MNLAFEKIVLKFWTELAETRTQTKSTSQKEGQISGQIYEKLRIRCVKKQINQSQNIATFGKVLSNLNTK